MWSKKNNKNLKVNNFDGNKISGLLSYFETSDSAII